MIGVDLRRGVSSALLLRCDSNKQLIAHSHKSSHSPLVGSPDARTVILVVLRTYKRDSDRRRPESSLGRLKGPPLDVVPSRR